MAMLVVLAAVLLVDGVSAGNKMNYGANRDLPLDMAPNSVDDMYSSCTQDMSKVVKQYLQNEENTNSGFKAAWDSSMAQYNRKWKRAQPFLGRECIVALYTYTFGPGDIYKDFNDAVRVEGPLYKTDFGFHALHFYLTTAIQKLNSRRRGNLQQGEDGCLTSYRRVNKSFRQNVVNTQFRFGSFASSSLGGYSNNVALFGDKSCFEIYSCMGADVSMYSKFENEGEVLIPPYEVFKVVGVQKRSQQPNLPCEVVYNVRSTGQSESKLDCALFQS